MGAYYPETRANDIQRSVAACPTHWAAPPENRIYPLSPHTKHPARTDNNLLTLVFNTKTIMIMIPFSKTMSDAKLQKRSGRGAVLCRLIRCAPAKAPAQIKQVTQF